MRADKSITVHRVLLGEKASCKFEKARNSRQRAGERETRVMPVHAAIVGLASFSRTFTVLLTGYVRGKWCANKCFSGVFSFVPRDKAARRSFVLIFDLHEGDARPMKIFRAIKSQYRAAKVGETHTELARSNIKRVYGLGKWAVHRRRRRTKEAPIPGGPSRIRTWT